MKTLDEQIEKNKNVRFARMQRFRKTHREHINVLPKAMRHNLLAKLKTPIVMVTIFFLARTGFCQGDTTAWLPNYIAAVVESERTIDSLQTSTLDLVPFQKEIFRVARKHGLPPALLAAFVQQESRFDQWATRTEPHYKKKKVVINEAKAWTRKSGGIPTVNTEIDDRSRSYGLGQVMGQKAREQGFDSKYLAAMYDPEKNINAIAIEVKRLFRLYSADTLSAISAYNQGNNRKENGIFKNMPYVYNVTQYWKHYKKLFAKLEYNEHQKKFNRIRDSILIRLSPWNMAGMFGLPRGTDSLGIAEPPRITTSDTAQGQRTDQRRDTAASYYSQSKGESNGAFFVPDLRKRYRHVSRPNIFLVVSGLVGLLGLGWFFLQRERYHARISGYNQLVPSDVDKAVQRNLRRELKKTRKGRALHRVGHRLANTRSNTHG